MESLVMKRILKIEPKRRIKTNPRVEQELLNAIVINGLDISDTFNIAIEKHLVEKGIKIREQGT